MKRSRFSEEQIIGILKEHEAGVSLEDMPFVEITRIDRLVILPRPEEHGVESGLQVVALVRKVICQHCVG